MVNALLMMGVLVTSPQSPPQTIQTGCLYEVVRKVFPDKSYTVTYVQDIEFAPVVYEFRNPVGTKNDLRKFCDALLLNCEIDEEKHTIKISRTAKLTGVDRRKQIEEYLDFLSNYLKPYWQMSLKEVYQIVQDKQTIIDVSHETSEAEEMRVRLAYKQKEALRLLLEPECRAILMTLLDNRSAAAQILSQRCTPINNLSLSNKSKDLLNLVLNGGWPQTPDIRDRSQYSEEEWKSLRESSESRRQEQRELGALNPIPVLRHSQYTSGTDIEIVYVTPDGSETSERFEISFDIPRRTTPIPDAFDKLDISSAALGIWKPDPVGQMEDPFFSSRCGMSFNRWSINGFGFLARDLSANHVSWLSTNAIWMDQGKTLKKYLANDPSVQAYHQQGWFSVYAVEEPLLYTSRSWKHFFALQRLSDSSENRSADVLKYLNGLTSSELKGLEDIGQSYGGFPQRYEAITSGVRLYKIALPYLLANQSKPSYSVVIPFEKLSTESQSEIRAFLNSNHVWNNMPALLHPQNRERIASLGVELNSAFPLKDARQNIVKLSLPTGWHPYDSSFSLEFCFPAIPSR